jgi:hypothetical protein
MSKRILRVLSLIMAILLFCGGVFVAVIGVLYLAYGFFRFDFWNASPLIFLVVIAGLCFYTSWVCLMMNRDLKPAESTATTGKGAEP